LQIIWYGVVFGLTFFLQGSPWLPIGAETPYHG